MIPPNVGQVTQGAAAAQIVEFISRRRRFLGFLMISAFLLIVFIAARPLGHQQTGDSNNLITGARVAVGCVREGQFERCGRYEGSDHTAVYPYPLLQYVPVSALIQMGFDDTEILGALGSISFLAFTGSLLGVVWVFRWRPKVAALSLLSLLASSWLYQSTSAFGEGLAAALVVAAVIAAIRRRPVTLFVLVALASLSKETIAPFISILALVCARSPDDRWLPRRSLVLAAVAGGLAGLSANFAFNVFRFGTWRNLTYLIQETRTDTTAHKVEFFAAIIGSPSAGVVWFWPVFSLLTVSGLAIGIRRLVRSRRDYCSWLPVIIVVFTLAGWFAFLSSWYSPFGWISFGPRLEVPLLGGAAVAIAHLVGDTVVVAIERNRNVSLAFVTALLIGALQFASPWRYAKSINTLIIGSQTCPPMTGLDILEPDLYYRCTTDVLWRVRPPVLKQLFEVSASVGGTAWIVALAGCLLLLWFVGSRRTVDQIEAQPLAFPQPAIEHAATSSELPSRRREVQPPDGWTRRELKDLLGSISIDGAPPGEMRGYLEQDFERFLLTWDLARGTEGKLLEIGANPYFTTVLLREFTDLEVEMTNSFDPDSEEVFTQLVSYEDPATRERTVHQFTYRSLNVERAPFPYPSDHFDTVIFCEVIEHLLMDPVAALREIQRVLKPDGLLILSTPNVARFENVARLIAGVNIYDPYSGYGPYGRHNREFSRDELYKLLTFVGFNPIDHFTADVHPNVSQYSSELDELERMVAQRGHDLGQYIFFTARNGSGTPDRLPAELYRSWPNERLASWN
jgi:SAM-dependent methyltransferase